MTCPYCQEFEIPPSRGPRGRKPTHCGRRPCRLAMRRLANSTSQNAPPSVPAVRLCIECRSEAVERGSKALRCPRCLHIRREATRKTPHQLRVGIDAQLERIKRARLARERATGVRTFTLTAADTYAQRETVRYIESGGE